MTDNDNVSVKRAITELDEVGYTILRGFVDQQRVEDLGRLAEKYFKPADAETRRAAATRDYSDFDSEEAARKSLLVQTREVDDLVTDQRVLSIAEAVLLEGPTYYRRVRTAGTGFKDAFTDAEDVRSLHRDGSIYPVRIPGKPLVLNTLCLAMLYVCGWLQPFNNYNVAFSDEALEKLPDKLAALI